MTLKVLPTTCFRYSSDKISSKCPIPKIKLNGFDSASFLMQLLKNFEKMAGFNKSFRQFFSKRLPINFNPSQNVSPILLFNGLLMVTNQG